MIRRQSRVTGNPPGPGAAAGQVSLPLVNARPAPSVAVSQHGAGASPSAVRFGGGEAQVVKGMPFDEYRKVDAVNSGLIKDVLVSPLYARYRMTAPRESTDTLVSGQIGHSAVLEPDMLLRDYVVWGSERGSRRGKEWEAFKLAAGSKTIITEDQFRSAVAMRDSVRSHPIAGKLVSGGGTTELSIFWVDQRTSMKMKARIDLLLPTVLVDVKTTRDPSPHAFQSTAARLSYFLQMAVYLEAVMAADFGLPEVKILAVQNVPPYDVVVYDLDAETLGAGHAQMCRGLDKIIECKRTDYWPGMAHDVEVPLRLPAWANPEQEEIALTFNGQDL